MSKEKQLDLLFKALADETRRNILEMIAGEEKNVTELAKPFDMSLNAVSKHLMVLEKAGLLVRKKDGRVHRCKMDPSALEPAINLIQYYQTFWEDQLDGLETYLNEKMQAKSGEEDDHQ